MFKVSEFFARHPRVLSAAMGGLSFALGDILAQGIEASAVATSIAAIASKGVAISKSTEIALGRSGNSDFAVVESKPYVEDIQLCQNYQKNDNIEDEEDDDGDEVKDDLGRLAGLDIGRVLRTAAYGSFMSGLVLYQWFRVVDLVFGSTMVSTRTVLLKMVADQIVYAPFSIVAYYGVSSVKYIPHHTEQSVLEQGQTDIEQGDSHANDGTVTADYSDISSALPENTLIPPLLYIPFEFHHEKFADRMESSFWSTYAADWSVWPAVNFINFRFVPLHMRPSFVGIAQLCWSTYLSNVTNSGHTHSHSHSHHLHSN